VISVSLLKELIKIESSNIENINRAVEFTAEYLKQKGIFGEILENQGYKSYVASIGQGEKTLVLNGHLDVVSGKPGQFEPVEKDGKLFGRGSADMKGGCVSMVEAMIRLKDMNLASKVMLQLVPDEETGGKNGTRYLVEQGYVGDFVICTEPTNLKISLQSKGIIVLEIETKGFSAHGSRPWEGVNAITKAMENYRKIIQLEILNRGSEYYEKSSVNLASIKGGDVYNKVPDSCTMVVDIRYVPHLDPHEIIDHVKKGIEGDVHVNILEPGVDTKPDNPYLEKLKHSLSAILPEESVEFSVQHGGSDARYFSQKGIPSIELGPKGKYWHGDEEYVETQSVKDLENILIDFALNF
jgi:succinyl-diaminopimelate desuccinylase